MSETKKNLTKENLLKELPEMGKNLDAIRKGTNTELSADISMAEVVKRTIRDFNGSVSLHFGYRYKKRYIAEPFHNARSVSSLGSS